MAKVDIMPDASEVVHYDRPDLPLYIRPGALSNYPDHKALCHWHEDFEFIRVYDGEMDYFISGEHVHLHAGDCLFVNSRQMHYGYSRKQNECHFLCVLVSPEILTGSQELFAERIEPLTKNSGINFLVIDGNAPGTTVCRNLLDRLLQIKESGKPYELRALAILLELVSELSERADVQQEAVKESPNLEAHRRMVAFIAAHFDEDITLDDIAASASVSRSTCCRIFRKYDQLSPVEFLTIYRLQISADLLIRTNDSISMIAEKCGFHSVSYYSKLFSAHFGIPPHIYRNMADRD